MRQFRSRIEFRTSLEQAARVAALAGELGESEAWVVRELLERGLNTDPHGYLTERAASSEQDLEAAIERAQLRDATPIR